MADNRIAYGLAKKYGIDTKGMSPGEVWEALKGKGITRQNAEEKYNTDGAGGTHEATPAEKKRLKEIGIQESGAQSGALDADNKDWERAKKHAALMYETFRNITSDVPKIAKITGYTEEEIQRVKEHMFFNEYDLADGHHRFHPNFDQAQSWDRLWKGNPIDVDYIMIKHELAEEPLMKKGMSYLEAHEEANKTANYAVAMKEYKDATIEKKRD